MAKHADPIDPDDVNVHRGEAFLARGPRPRRVVVDAVTWETGVPRAECHAAGADPLDALRAALEGDAPPSRPSMPDRPFEVALTWSGGKWRMPAAYAPCA